MKKGFTCSCFDLMHPGHIKMLQDARDQCDYLIVGLQEDPTIDRPYTKNKPIQTLEERQIMLASVRFVDQIVIYESEKELYNYLKTHVLKYRVKSINKNLLKKFNEHFFLARLVPFVMLLIRLENTKKLIIQIKFSL